MRRFLLAAALTLGFVGWGAFVLLRAAGDAAELDVRSVPWRTHGGRLGRVAPFGELFHCETDGLHRIDLALTSLGAPRSEPLTLELRADGPEGELLRRATIEVAKLSASGGHARFEFERLPDSAARRFHATFLPEAEDSALSPWISYRGQVGLDAPWGDVAVEEQSVEQAFLSPLRNLRALGFALPSFDPAAGPATLELRLEGASEPLRRTSLRPSERTRDGFVFFAFEPIPDSRGRRYRYRLQLPAGGAVVTTDGRPTLKTYHGSESSRGGLLGLTRGPDVLDDRDLVLRTFTKGGRALLLERLRAELGDRLVLAALAWIFLVALVAATWIVRRPGRSRAGVLFVVALLHVLIFRWLLPPWMGEDEPWQLELAHHVAGGHWPVDGPEFDRAELRSVPYAHLQLRRRLPELSLDEIAAFQRSILASMERHRFDERVDWSESWMPAASFDEVAPGYAGVQHPPLFPALAALALVGARDAPPEAQLARARWVSALAYLATIAAALALARALFEDDGEAVAAAACVALIPVLARHGAVLNNDVLAQAFGAGAVAVAARVATGRARRLEGLLAIALAGLAAAAKTTGAGVALPVALAFVLRARRRSRAALLAALALFAAAFGYARLLSDHDTAVPLDWPEASARLGSSLRAPNLRLLGATTFGAFNWYSRTPSDAAVLGTAAAFLLAAVGTAVAGRRGRVRRPAAWIAASAVGAQLALVALRGVAVFRYLLPVAPALWLLLPAGTAALGERARSVALRALLAALVLYEGWYVWGGLIPNQYWILGD